MAQNTNTQKSPESGAKWRLEILLTSPFSFIGRQVIRGVNNLGAATIFLYLALIKTFRSKQLPKTVQQLYYIGAKSTTIIMLVSLFTGMVLSCLLYTSPSPRD